MLWVQISHGNYRPDRPPSSFCCGFKSPTETTDLTVRLRLFGVGSNLPRKRTRRGGRRKQRKSADTCTTHLRQHWSTTLPPSLAPDSSSPPSSPLTRSSSSPPLTSSTPLASLSPPSSSPQRLLPYPQPALTFTSSPPSPPVSPVPPTLPSCLSHPQPPLSPSSPRPSSSPVTPTLPSCPSPSPYPQPPPSPTSYRPPSSSPSPCDTLSRSMQPPTCDPVFRDSPSLPLFSSSFFSKSHNVHNENHNVSIEPSSPILHPICNPNKLKMCLFNAQSVCKDGKADAIADFIHNGQVDIAFITETWLNSVGHEPIEKCLTPTDYRLASFPRPTLGGGIAILYKDSLHPLLSFSQSLPFSHSSFEHVQVCFQSTPHPIYLLLCLSTST